MHRSVGLAAAALACAAASSHADFIVPTVSEQGWARGQTPGSVYGEWDSFTSPHGPNAPDVGSFIGGELPEDAPELNAFDANEASGSFIVSSGNIYSFSGYVSPQVDLPGFDLGDGHTTTILLQFRTQGSEFDPTSVLLNNTTEPDEIVELFRGAAGSGGAVVDTLVRFEVGGDLSSYTINFTAQATSMSLDRVAIDSFTRPAGCGAADLAAPLGVLDLADINAFVTAFSSGDDAADLAAPAGVLDLADINAFVGSFSAGCP